MTVLEKVAYLKGLIDALDIDRTTKEGKIVCAVADILDDMACDVADMENEISEMAEDIDAIDEDLGDLEDDFYETDEDEDDDEFDDDDDGEYFSIKCPNCGDEICINESLFDEDEICCPNCGEKIEFDFSEDDLDDDADEDEE